MRISVAQMRMVLRSFPCLHTLTLYGNDTEDAPETDTKDAPDTDTGDLMHQDRSHDEAVRYKQRAHELADIESFSIPVMFSQHLLSVRLNICINMAAK